MISMKMVYKALACEITAQPRMDIAINNCAEEDELTEEAIIYAVCRCFVKSENLCRECNTESYAMRFATGKNRRTKHHTVTIPAAALELPGMWVRIGYTVDAAGVKLEKISLHNNSSILGDIRDDSEEDEEDGEAE